GGWGRGSHSSSRLSPAPRPPGEAILARHQVLHVGVRAILGPAAHGDEPAMAELVDVVLDAPQAAGFVGELGPNLARDDLVGVAVAGEERLAVEVDDHPLAHRVEDP